ncbi:metallophosphoesterase [Paucisalibacillus globulus]|uniref:metallophosphoesterase n=1 Tax=Paucisalibacillus globulus TaxID=351095 RepID=UPI00042A8C29|nr:metallophosphoesterase [Paucisalibacillus globulus]
MPRKNKEFTYFRKYKKRIVFALGILFILSTAGKVIYDTNVFKVNRVEFQTNKIPTGSEISILQISDVHNKVFGGNNEKLIETVKKIDTDLIVLTGDLVDRKTTDFSNVFSLVEELKVINPNTFFVTGNHEWENIYMEELLVGLEERGVTMLNNENTQVTLGEATINLVGIDNESTNHENMSLAFDNVNRDFYTVLLSHSPGVIEKYQDIPADLILSGHTHGGQVRIPLIGAVVAPDQGFFPELDKGIFKIGGEQYLYIDSGLGTSVAPLRFWNQSQMSLVQIRGI